MNGDRQRLRIGVIVDRMTLARWQAEALRTLTCDADLLVYNCINSRPGLRRPRHALYYLLNLFTVRNRMTRRQSWPADLQAPEGREFEALHDGAWERLPPNLIEQLRADRLDAVVKFGMGLLRIPPSDQLAVPILSYHHGDPARFRGRPAGFHEILGGELVMGQVVQRLSNDLDAGDILASADTKISAHSYRATLIEAYRHSPLILRRAIENCVAGRSWRPDRWGKNYPLPSNRAVLVFLVGQCRSAAKHLYYGLFKEKRWNVATVDIAGGATLDSITSALSHPSNWCRVETPPGYRFLADPFFHPEGGLLVEGLNARSCRGELLHIGQGPAKRVSGRGGHYSYPATLVDERGWHIVPEMSEWSAARSYSLQKSSLGEPAELRIPGRPALLDPTVFQYDGLLYLFANLAGEGQSALRLWVADDLRGEFAEHPASPIRISPHGSRMAGGLCRIGDRLIRVGQDLRRAYGDGLAFFYVTHVDRHDYREEWVRDFRFDHCRGPHTLNIEGDCIAFDFYADRLTPWAGFRRLRERRAARTPG